MASLNPGPEQHSLKRFNENVSPIAWRTSAMWEPLRQTRTRWPCGMILQGIYALRNLRATESTSTFDTTVAVSNSTVAPLKESLFSYDMAAPSASDPTAGVLQPLPLRLVKLRQAFKASLAAWRATVMANDGVEGDLLAEHFPTLHTRLADVLRNMHSSLWTNIEAFAEVRSLFCVPANSVSAQYLHRVPHNLCMAR